MNPSRLSARDQRALRLGGAIIGVAFAVAFILQPWYIEVQDARERLAVQETLLATDLGLAEHREQIDRRSRNASRLQSQRLRTLFASENIAATDAFTDFVTREATASRVFVEATRNLPDSIDGSLLPTAVQLTGVADFAGAVDFLRRIEQSENLVLIDSLILEARDAQNSPVDVSSMQDLQLVGIDVWLTGFAYLPAPPMPDDQRLRGIAR